jgi:hypothetical protein
MKSEYLKCRNCSEIHHTARIDREWIPGTVTLRAHCSCGFDEFDEVYLCVITDCGKEAAKDDDFCPEHRDAEDERDFDMELAAVEEESRRRVSMDIDEALRDIARGVRV